jgi:beta-lactamase regulating signal transducer with metallopeptidase domain
MIGIPDIDAGAALALLLRATLAVSFAVLVLWPLRRALRRRFGAGVAYAAWWLIPAVAIACLLPARVQDAAPLAAPPAQIAAPVAAAVAEAPTFSIPAGVWLSLWALGALGMALRLWRQQRRFERALGELQPLPQRLWRSTARSGLPAVIGALRARIVLPEDFAQRYDHEQQRLLLAHERTHLHRGDPLANLAVAALRCLFWFNPLVHLAAARFRHDQELACDQAVIAAHPNSRRAYGEAMLKTLMTDRQAPLGCHWGFSHPLKERVMQLTSSAPRPWARRVGVAAVALSILGAGFAVWSAQPPRYVAAPGGDLRAGFTAGSTADFRAELQLRIDDDAPTRFAIADDYGKPFSFAHRGADGERLQIEGVVRETADRGHDIALVLKQDGREIAKPRLIAARNAPAVVRIGGETPAGGFDGVELTLAIAPADAPAPPAPPSPPHAPAPLAPQAAIAPLAPMAPPARPAALAPLAPPAPPAPPSQPAPPAPSAPPAPPAPPAAAPVAHEVDTARIARAVRAQTARAEAARAAALSARADAARSAEQAEAVRADVARAAAAAEEAKEAARAAEAMAALADTQVAAAQRARNAAMSEQQRAAEMAAIRAQIAGERERLRAAAAAREAAAAQMAAEAAAARAAEAP